MRVTRKLLVPIRLSSGKVLRDFLIPDLSIEPDFGFVKLNSGKFEKYGLLVYTGIDVNTTDILEKYNKNNSLVIGIEEARARIELYIEKLQKYKIGNILTVVYKNPVGNFILRKELEKPNSKRAPLP